MQPSCCEHLLAFLYSPVSQSVSQWGLGGGRLLIERMNHESSTILDFKHLALFGIEHLRSDFQAVPTQMLIFAGIVVSYRPSSNHQNWPCLSYIRARLKTNEPTLMLSMSFNYFPPAQESRKNYARNLSFLFLKFFFFHFKQDFYMILKRQTHFHGEREKFSFFDPSCFVSNVWWMEGEEAMRSSYVLHVVAVMFVFEVEKNVWQSKLNASVAISANVRGRPYSVLRSVLRPERDTRFSGFGSAGIESIYLE